MGEDQIETSFWFHRPEDEPFAGNLADKDADESVRASKVYADFIAASADMSLKSFDNVLDFSNLSRGTITGSVYPIAIANIPEPLTWKQWTWKNRFTIMMCGYAVVAAVFLAIFVVPGVQLQNGVLDCEVRSFSVFDISCSESEKGYCVEQEVVLNIPEDNIRVFSSLQGFPEVNSDQIDKRLSCAVSNCSSDSVNIPDQDELGIGCDSFLEDENITVANLTEPELWGCGTLGKTVPCVYITSDASPLFKWYFGDAFASNKNGQVVSTPKGPSIPLVAGVAGAVLGPFVILIIVGVVRHVQKRRKKKVNDNEEGNPTIKNGILYQEPPATNDIWRQSAQVKMAQKMRQNLK